MIQHIGSRFGSVRILLTVGALFLFSAVLLNGSPGQAQTPPATASAASAAPEFEAVSIKPVKEPNPGRMNDREEGRRFSTHYTSLSDLILMAYQVDRQQVVGGPAWMRTDEYDVDAVAGEEIKYDERFQAMLQKLLADRFQLTFHREQREMSVYTLTFAKGGPKLKPSDPNVSGNGASCDRLGVCHFRGVPMAQLARWMGFVVLAKPVNDKTGLEGKFDFDLTWTPDESQFAGMGIRVPQAADNPNAPPELFTAIQEQLGLKLEPQKVPAEVLVIDRVERPSEN
jgi:uncharacterized protein (TIGR03435 family)